MAHDDAILSDLRHISKAFTLPSGSPVRVLEDVSLEVREEEILAILGPSGCGKSTLMRVLAGLITPDSGEILYRGKKLDGLNPGVAIVFQSFALYPWLTVAQNIVEPLRARGLGRREAMAAADRVIHLVGLAGFEDVYPRELSGGMKQRVGIARAVAVEPEILCMDEPFSQVDALTAEILRGEVVRFWGNKATNPKTIFMVSHDVKEVVFMATRIVILGARPGRVRTIIENELSYPRDYRAPEFQRLVDQIHAIITETEMPDAPTEAAPSPGGWEPLPDAAASEILGLLRILDRHDGRADVFALVDKLGREFGKILAVVKAAELLDFADTPGPTVILTRKGRELLAGAVPERKQIFRRQVSRLRLFSDVVRQIRASDRQEIDEYGVLSQLALDLPYEDAERQFKTLVDWGRQADLFDYDPERQKLFIEEQREEPATGSS